MASKKGTPRQIPDDVVVQILLSEKSAAAVSRECGCSRWMVRQIQLGHQYRDVRPDIERHEMMPHLAKDSCHACVMWDETDRCTLGVLEGQHGSFAPICAYFLERHEAHR